MFYVFTGDDRGKILEEVKKILGEDYEVFEGEKLEIQDIVNICQGVSLFSPERKVLIRDLTPARKEKEESADAQQAAGLDFYAELIKYVNTPHKIVIWETTTSKRKSFLEFKKTKGVKALDFKTAEDDWKRPFEVADMALVDPKKAVLMLREIEDKADPYMFVGVLTTKFCERYGYRFGKREKERLMRLAEVDMKMKTGKIAPWKLVEGFILSL